MAKLATTVTDTNMNGSDSPCACRDPTAALFSDAVEDGEAPVVVADPPLGVADADGVPADPADWVLLPGWLIWSAARDTTLMPVTSFPLLSLMV